MPSILAHKRTETSAHQQDLTCRSFRGHFQGGVAKAKWPQEHSGEINSKRKKNTVKRDEESGDSRIHARETGRGKEKYSVCILRNICAS